MTNSSNHETVALDTPEAVVHERSRFSLVWLIPLVAVTISAWLIYKTLSEQGPEITITFKTAEGLQEGKTKIRFKEVEVGQVEDIVLADDLSHVVVKAKVTKDTAPYLTDQTRFWVVRARVAAGQVSDLGTLFSGAYIGMDPIAEGEPERHFVGLDRVPLVTTHDVGRTFVLQSLTLGSLDVASPVYFRKIKVGRVVSYELSDSASVKIQVFIDSPHDQRVNSNTVFWNASGLDFSLSADGINVDTESMLAMMIGGVAFGTPARLGVGDPVAQDAEFTLHRNRASLDSGPVYAKEYHRLYFGGSVRGLKRDAPVEFRGVLIGRVSHLRLEFDTDNLEFRIPVLIEVEPDRLHAVGSQTIEEVSGEGHEAIAYLVKRGLRAQLKTGNLLTGQLYVDLDFHPRAKPVDLVVEDGVPVIPTIPSPIDALRGSVMSLMRLLEGIPVKEIGSDLQGAIRAGRELAESEELRSAISALNATLQNSETLTGRVNSEVVPSLSSSLDQAERTLRSAQTVLREDSPLHRELKRTLEELSTAARSIRLMADYLERHPEALIQGKRGR